MSTLITSELNHKGFNNIMAKNICICMGPVPDTLTGTIAVNWVNSFCTVNPFGTWLNDFLPSFHHFLTFDLENFLRQKNYKNSTYTLHLAFPDDPNLM